jgi:hypothetical protein
MKNLLRAHPRWSALIGVIVFIALLFMAAPLYGFEVHIFEPDPVQQLQAAKSLWQQKGSDSYRMEVVGGPFTVAGDFLLTFRNGILTEAKSRNPISALANPAEPFQPINDPNTVTFNNPTPYPTTLQDFSMNHLFDIAESLLKSMPPAPLVSFCGQDGRYYTATFDPNLGYLASFEYNDCFIGATCGALSECVNYLRVKNFELLNDGG